MQALLSLQPATGLKLMRVVKGLLDFTANTQAEQGIIARSTTAHLLVVVVRPHSASSSSY